MKLPYFFAEAVFLPQAETVAGGILIVQFRVEIELSRGDGFMAQARLNLFERLLSVMRQLSEHQAQIMLSNQTIRIRSKSCPFDQIMALGLIADLAPDAESLAQFVLVLKPGRPGFPLFVLIDISGSLFRHDVRVSKR